MRDKKRWKSLAAWALAFSMAMGNSGVMVMAESTDAEWAVEESAADYTETQAETVSEEAAQSEVGVEEDAEEAESESAIGTEAAQEETLSKVAVSEDTAAAGSQNTVNAGADSEEASEFASEMETSGFTAGDEASAFISESTDTTDELDIFTDENGDGSDDEEQDGYFFDVAWPDDDYKMLTSNDKDIPIRIRYEWYEDGELCSKYINDYSLELIADENGKVYDSEFIEEPSLKGSPSDPECRYLHIDSKTKLGITQLNLRAIIGNEEERVLVETIEFEICEFYYKLMPTSLTNPDVGCDLDFSELYVEVIGEDSTGDLDQKTENIEYKITDYDEIIWQLTTTEDGKSSELRRIECFDSWITIAAYIENEEADLVEICRRDFWFDEVEYPVEFAENSVEIFDDEENFEVSLNTMALENRKVEIFWWVGYTNNIDTPYDDANFKEISTNAEVPKFWSIDYDSEVLKVNGRKLADAYDWARYKENLNEEYKFVVKALVIADTKTEEGKLEVGRTMLCLNSREAVYDYHLGEYNDRHITLADDIWVSKLADCYIENAEHREGDNQEYEITDVTVNNAEGEDDTLVFSVKERENGWSITPNRSGIAILTIEYTDVNGEKAYFDGTIYADKDVYHLEVEYPDNDTRILVNSTRDIEVKLYHQWAYSEEIQGYGPVSNFKLELQEDQNGVSFDEEVITASVSMDETENWYVHINTKDRPEWTSFMVRASIQDEDGNWISVAEQEVEAEIYNEMYVIEGELPTDILVGDAFNINDYKDKLQLMKYSDGEEPVQVEFSSLDVDWDNMDAWQVDDSTGNYIRTSWDEIRGRIEAEYEVSNEEDTWTESVSREIVLGSLDYWTWFENLRQDEYSTFVYDDETYELALNDKNLTDKKVKVQWEVGYYVGGEEEPPFTPIDKTTLGAFWSEDSENPFALIIDGKALKTAYERLSELVGEDKDCWIDVNARIVTDNKAEIEVIDKRSATISSREAWGEYNYQARSVQMLPGEEYALENTIGYYEENGTYPYGNPTELKIQDITLETEKGEEAPITLEKKDDHWLVTAKSMGHADAVIAYTDIDGNAATWRVEFYVIGSIYFVSTEAGNRDIWMLNGEELTVPVKAYVQELDENGKLKVTEVPESTYTLSLVDDEEFSYDRNLINEAKVEGNSLTVKADPNGWGNGEVRVYAASKEQENGEPVWDAYGQFYVNVQTAYYTVYPASLTENDQSIGAYESLDLNQYDLSVKFTETDKNGEKVTTNCENVRYILEYDKEQWECVKDSEELTVPILKRISAAPTWVNLIAQTSRVDAYGNTVWEDAANQIFSFERIVDWTCVHNWEVTKKVDATCTAAGSISYTCTKCGETKTDSIKKLSHNIVTVTDREATCGQPGKQHQECSLCGGERKDLPDLPVTGKHEWKVLKTTAATCTAEGSIEYICGVCRQTKSESIKKLAHNMVTVTDSEPTCGQSGKQHKECSLCHGEITPLGDIPATGNHTWSAYVRTADPTAAAEGTEERNCSVCGTKETKAIAKLAPFVKVASTSFPMKKSQSVSLAATLEKGDKIQTVTSNNTKLVKASVKGNTVTLKAGKKATKGTVKVTITTACGASQTITVKLQSSTVQAKKITGVSKTLTLKVKKSATLKPAVNPISCKTKVTYKSSNSKIASVSSKGVIKAKKAGTTTITVTCGKVSVKCKVTVKKK